MKKIQIKLQLNPVCQLPQLFVLIISKSYVEHPVRVKLEEYDMNIHIDSTEVSE